MLVATRDHHPHADAAHFAAVPPRTLTSRFTSGVQLLGSLVGIPLALIGGYSTYHANFSPQAKCQALRGNIISMLDKKADASTLRLLVYRDVVNFERDCGGVDAEAAAAFKTLLATEKTSPRAKTQIAKIEKAEAIRPEPARKPAAPVSSKSEAEKPAHGIKPVVTAAPPAETSGIDAVWVASVRDVLRESASRPPAADSSDMAAPMPPPIVVPAEPQRVGGTAPATETSRAADHPVPPAPIPSAN